MNKILKINNKLRVKSTHHTNGPLVDVKILLTVIEGVGVLFHP